VIRVLLVDDHASFRQPLAFMLDREEDISVVGQAGSLAEARQLLAEAVDVAVVDLNLPDGHGVELIRELRAVNPAGMVVVVTGSAVQHDYAEAVEAGASGVLHKSAGIEEIIKAVRRAGAGEPLLSSRELVELLRLADRHRIEDHQARVALARLTPREQDVLQALADGLADKEIADRLNIRTETVRTHMVNILGKLGVDSRLQALVFAIRHGLVTLT
jgi:two-component system, NarL family, response regulator DevR